MGFNAVIFNKPYDVVTQFSASGDGRTLANFRMHQGVYPCGRLDKDSEGLLLLINDGKLQNRLTDPKRGHPRTYLVQVEGIPEPEQIEKLREGVKLKDGLTRPCEVKLLADEPDLPERKPPVRYRKNVPTSWLEMTLVEGKNRQVRRMTAAISHPTLRLMRVKIGTLTLEGLTPGQWRFLTKEEARKLRSAGFVYRKIKSKTKSFLNRRSKRRRS
jgi:23S rRNA pseudouridine2457 synthase